MKWTETVDLGPPKIGVIGDPKIISGATPKSSVDLGFVTKISPPRLRQNLRVAEVLIESISMAGLNSSVEFTARRHVAQNSQRGATWHFRYKTFAHCGMSENSTAECGIPQPNSQP